MHTTSGCFDQKLADVAAAGGAIEQQGDAALVSDPSGNRLSLTLSDPAA
jgi:hypothetical protein